MSRRADKPGQSGQQLTGKADATADTTPPVAITQNTILLLGPNGKAILLASAINNGSTDDTGIATMSVSTSRFTCTDIGANTVVLTVRDASGNQNTATAIVTVVDRLASTVYCQSIFRQLDANGQVRITPLTW